MSALTGLKLKTLVICSTLFAGLFGNAIAQAEVVYFDTYRYAAVAYSTTTGKYGYAYNHGTLAGAKKTALGHCEADDAEIVGWVQGGFLVLAIGDDNSYGVGWEYGDGARIRDAAATAEANCKSYGTQVVKLVYLCSGDIAPRIVTTQP